MKRCIAVSGIDRENDHTLWRYFYDDSGSHSVPPHWG